MMLRFIFAALLLPTTSFAREASEIQLGRFETWLQILENNLGSTEDKSQAANLLVASSDSRIAAFNLQALARLYAKVDVRFDKMKSKAKDLEDALGEVDKWAAVGDAARKANAIDELADVLSEDLWIGDRESPRIEKFRKILRQVPWQSPAKEKSELAGVIEKQLVKVDQTKYTFANLEEGNGLHELRRELRWFLIEARVLGGLIQFKSSNDCALPAYAELLDKPIAKSKYAGLPTTDPGISPCRISQCLFLGAVEAVEEFGALKDQAEKILAKDDNDSVPDEIRLAATQRYQDMKSKKLIPELIKEIRACR